MCFALSDPCHDLYLVAVSTMCSVCMALFAFVCCITWIRNGFLHPEANTLDSLAPLVHSTSDLKPSSCRRKNAA